VKQVVMFTPLPPAKTGVAHYASMLIPALRQQIDVEAVGEADLRPATTDLRIYQLGNNPHHEFVYREAMAHPGVVVLHDIVLHHLIVEMTLARGDVEGYVTALRANHGAAGEAWARGRAAGLHSEMGNFLLPASIDVANRSRAVIVHNQYAADVLHSHGVRAPIHVVPHPYLPQPATQTRRKATNERVIGLFGFLNSSKRPEVVLEAFGQARARDPRLRLLVVGDPAPNIDVAAFRSEGITFNGYVADEEFASHYAAVDRLVNLRYPTAGETSGTLIRAFEAGKPVAVSDYAQFAEMPNDCVVKIPLGEGEVAALAEFFVRDLPDPSAAQRRWLEENARMELTVKGYIDALSGAQAMLPASADKIVYASQSLPLFPRLELLRLTGNTLTIRNDGQSTLRTREYGFPGYRLIAKIFYNGGEIYDRWLEFPCDLAPGETTTVELPGTLGSGTLALYHAMEGIPMLAPEAWARVAIQ